MAGCVELSRSAGSRDGGQNSRVEGVTVRKIHVGHPGALPGDRPTAALLADTVGPVARHEHVLVRIQRQ